MRVEGWCSTSADGTTDGTLRLALGASQPLVLWHNAVMDDWRTCGGTADCAAAAMQKQGYTQRAHMCYAYPAYTAADLPCKFALPSIARNDSSFWDQIYWRGRQWAPQTFLTYARLRQVDGNNVSSPSASRTRSSPRT